MFMLERGFLFVAVFLYKELAIGDHIKITYVPVKERKGRKGKGSGAKRKGRKKEKNEKRKSHLV